ncbi:MAG: hypothetical protein OXG60_06670 [Chloroflexi bacterium]|nr:hypothetical protein [Chloroflexota bacterium]
MKKAKKRTGSRAIGCRRLFLAACIALGLLCSLPFILTSPELQWHLDHNVRPPVITPAPASKESDLIAFICEQNDGNQPAGVYVVEPDGSHLKQIHARPHESYEYLSWSRDGIWVAVVAGSHSLLAMLPDEKFEIFRVRFDGLDTRRLTYNHSQEIDPRWSNVGRSVSFITRGAIHRISDSGHEISRSYNSYIKPYPWGRRVFDWSSDDRKLVIVGTHGAVLYSTNPDGSDLGVLTRAETRPDAVAWAANDEQILYYSRDMLSDYKTLTVFNVTSRSEDTSLKMDAIQDARWSPNSEWIAIKGRALDESEGEHIYLLDIDTGAMNYVTTMSTGDFGGISWSPDSEWIAFSTSPRRGGDGRIFKIKRDGTALHQLAEIDCRIIEISWSPK